MAIIPIVKMGNPVLRRVAEQIKDLGDEEIRNLVIDMRDSMAEVGGVGLAAPQIGISLSLVIFEVPAARMQSEDGDEENAKALPSTVLINPVITPLGEEKELGWEGCLSVPGLRGLVPRYTRIRYTGIDLDGNSVDVEAYGFHARVVQHECDHLDGILYPERMTDLKYLVYESEMQAFMESFDTLQKDGEG